MNPNQIYPSRLAGDYSVTPDRSRYYTVTFHDGSSKSAYINDDHVVELLTGGIPDNDDVKQIETI